MKWILPAVLLFVLALIPSVTSPNLHQAFQPAYDIVSLSPNTPNAHGTIAQHISVPATDHPIGSIKFTLPAGWDIANVQTNDDLPIVGTGLLRADVDQTNSGGRPCDSVIETYNLTIVYTESNTADPPYLK